VETYSWRSSPASSNRGPTSDYEPHSSGSVIHLSAATSRGHRQRHDFEIVDPGELSRVSAIEGEVVGDRSCRDHRIEAHFDRVPNPTRCNRK
jgi:hypothetical protein